MVIESDQFPDDPVASFEEFFRTFEDRPNHFKYRLMISEAYSSSSSYIVVLFEDILNFDPQLAHYLRNSPEKALEQAIEAFKNILAIDAGGMLDYNKNYEIRISTLNNSNEVFLRNLRSSHVEKLVFVKGIVIKMGPPKPQIVVAQFQCSVCQARQSIVQKGEALTKPETCSNPNCTNKKKFELLQDLSEFIDHQRITIQEPPEDLPPGAIPRTIPAILKYGLVDTIRPGDRIKSYAIYRSLPVENNRGKEGTVFAPFLEINNIEKMKLEDEEGDVTQADIVQIVQLSRNPNIQRILVNSIAPSIYGNDHLKLAALLSLFGGVQKKTKGGSKIRGDIHVLFMGDPGTGKSQILQFCSKLIARSVYTSGKGASAAGLTAAVIRESDNSGYSLEAGALVLASGGVACIDEFDKMEKNDRSAIHQAMEQQNISISKAGINATLQSQTAIIAAANPKFGRYNPFKTPTDNINLPAPILSRFDLVFIVQDKPNPDSDSMIADFIINTHIGAHHEDDDVQVNQNQTIELLPVDLLRKYIRHARNSCFPKLTKEAGEKIKEFYLSLRNLSGGENNAVAIVARYLEGLIRMSEAFAKMSLRDFVTVEDAEKAIDLMNRSMREIGLDPATGKLDVDRLITGTSQSQVQRLELLLNLIKQMQIEKRNKPIKIKELIERAVAGGQLNEEFVLQGIEILVKESTIYNPRNDEVKLMMDLDIPDEPKQ